MNTLKKGDKCQSPWGELTLNEDQGKSEIVSVTTESGDSRLIHVDELKSNKPTHAERMQAVLDIAWDIENRLQDDETVQLRVGAFVEFARHYVKLQENIIDLMRGMQDRGNQAKIDMEKAEKTLKGETP